MVIGRRKSLFICIVVGIIGNSVTMIFKYPFLIIGRFLFGISTGLFSAIVPRYVKETIPAHLYEPVAAFFVTCHVCGENVAFLWGEYLPSNDNVALLRATERWRMIYFVFPVALYLFVLLALIFIIK